MKNKNVNSKKNNSGQKKLRAASFSIVANTFLILLKSFVAIISGSIALLAELAHSVFDLLASLLAYTGIKKAEEPADKTHHYGHEKFENLSSLAQTALIAIASFFIIYEAVARLFAPKNVEAIELGLVIMVVTVLVDYFVSRYLHRTSKEHSSSALEADAYHFTTDLWSAIAVIIGLGFVLLGYPIFDSIAAIAVALLMLYISFKLGRNAINVLIDRSPSEEMMKKIEEIVKKTNGITNFHNLRARQAGHRIFIELNIHVASKTSIERAHAIAHDVEKRLMSEMPEIKDVVTHTEPEEE